MSTTTSGVHTKFLEAYSAAFNRHDVDALMSMMTEDCVFETAAGPEACGTRHAGQAAVRTAFAAIFINFPDSKWGNALHFVSGNRGLSEWIFTGTPSDGKRLEVKGCDVFTFRNGKISHKDSFFKNRKT